MSTDTITRREKSKPVLNFTPLPARTGPRHFLLFVAPLLKISYHCQTTGKHHDESKSDESKEAKGTAGTAFQIRMRRNVT